MCLEPTQFLPSPEGECEECDTTLRSLECGLVEVEGGCSCDCQAGLGLVGNGTQQCRSVTVWRQSS